MPEVKRSTWNFKLQFKALLKHNQIPKQCVCRHIHLGLGYAMVLLHFYIMSISYVTDNKQLKKKSDYPYILSN